MANNDDTGYNPDLYDSWAAGVSDPNLPDGTNRPDLRDEIVTRSRAPKEIFQSIGTFKALPDSFLIINDIYFTNIPLTSINYESLGDVFIGETLRSSAPVIDSEGRQDFVLHLSLPFPPGEAQAIKLKRLMAELTQHPLVYIYNNDIKRKLGIEESETTMFILESGSLRSTTETVGLIILDLQLHYYNYKPFSKHFYFNAKLPGFITKTDDMQTSINVTERLDLDQLSGYEASDYLVTKIAEATTAKIRNEITNLYAFAKQNVPVNFPASSDAWMYFANHLESRVGPVSGIPSDAVGFRLREYKVFMPPDSKFTDSPSTLSDLLKERHKEIHPAYTPKGWGKALATQVKNEYEASKTSKTVQQKQAQETTEPTGVSPTRKIKFKNTINGQTISIPLLDNNGNVTNDAQLELSRLGDKRKQIDKDKNPVLMSKQLIRLFYQIANHYPDRTIEFVSGIRSGKGKKHPVGEAMDMRVSGVPNTALFGWAKDNLHQSGKGFYPNSVFVHIDTRNTDTIWEDLSAKGDKKSNYVPGSQAELHARFAEHYQDNVSEMEDDREEINRPAIKEARRDQQAEIAADRGNLAKNVEIQRQLKEAKTEEESLAIYQQKSHASKNSQEERQKWIEKIEQDEKVHYFYDDPKIRNVFYRDIQINISSDPSLQRSGFALKNIVCTGVSMTFGHRIAPMRLTSQRYYTYQFLGAGNKTGQLVFTFSGTEGKRSANVIAELFQKARQNAADFTSIIRSVGSVSLINTFFETGEQNTIFALSGINDIVISNISDSNAQDGADKYQLVIEFIAQDFAEEKLEEKFYANSEYNKKIISTLMSYITSRKLEYTDENIIMTDSKIAQFNNSGTGGAYVRVKDTPAWVAELLVAVARVCRNTDKIIPPVAWQMDKETGRTWREAYGEWGASHVFKGHVNKIHISERERATGSIYQKDKLKYAEAIESQKRNIFEMNGAPKTNTIHQNAFTNWLNEMAIIVREFKSHLNDEAVMDKYFPGIADEMINFLSGSIASCYADMHLPNVPGTVVPLPPEFYVYDDSHEDPLVSNMTDEHNMEIFLKRHVATEYISIEHYIKNCFLGGAYLSKNLPRILEQRASQHEQQEAEWDFSRYTNYYRNGTSAWEPLYERTVNMDTGQTRTKQAIKDWQEEVSEYYGSDKTKENFNYLSNIVELSAYIKEGRQWDTPITPTDNTNLVNSLYGNATKVLAFGPNPSFESVDAVNSGQALDPSKQRYADMAENKNMINSKNNTVESPLSSAKTATTRDNAVTFGNTDEEIEDGKPNAIDDLNKEVGNKTGLGTTGWKGVITRTISHNLPFLLPVLALAVAADPVIRLVDTMKSAGLDQSMAKYSHYLSEKVIVENEQKLIAQIAGKTALTNKRNDLSMRRAYPTFKIYFIEDDSGESELVNGKILRAFDDFYSYSAIQEIKIHMDREIAADMAIIRMTNIGGHLLRKRFGEADNKTDKYGNNGERQGIFADTEKEHPFEKMILQDGMKVQIRLGYSSNPDNLKSLFLGQIVEVSLAEGGKIIEIAVQGYGAELEAVELGPLEDGKIFYSSQSVLSGAIIQESIANFGRQDRFNLSNPAEGRHSWTGGKGASLISGLNPSNILSEWAQRGLASTFNRYTFLNYPQDDNIYAPSPLVYASKWMRFWNNACVYRPLKQTAWEIFKEHELRHPGYISMAVPYGHEPRMTMFFGNKMQHYWSKPPSALEVELARGAKNEIIKLRTQALSMGYMSPNALSEGLLTKLKQVTNTSPKLGAALINDILTSSTRFDTGFALAELSGRYIPFRNYHYFDSHHHILKNEIRTSVDGTFNEVEIYYTGSEDNILDTDAEDVVDYAQSMSSGSGKLFTVRLDENIPESSIRSFKGEYPSCITKDMAKKYAQGIFATTLRNAYKGELCVIGNENIKPYDVCFLNDTSINMTGPIEVQAVTHIFNRDYGYVCVITPDLCLEVNDFYNTSVFDVTASAMNMTWGDPTNFIPGYNTLKGLSFLALMAGVKIAMWSQEGSPVFATPLTLGGKPLLSNTLGPNDTTLFLSLYGRWEQYKNDVNNAWQKYDLSEAIFEARINFQKDFYQYLGAEDETGGLEEA